MRPVARGGGSLQRFSRADPKAHLILELIHD